MGRQGRGADDFQYTCGGCGYGMGDDRLNNYSRAPTCGESRKRAENQALGHSFGGFFTKMHAAYDALGNPLRLILKEGEAFDYTQSLRLLDVLKAKAILIDKGY